MDSRDRIAEIFNEQFIFGVLSDPKDKGAPKVQVSPFDKGGELFFQFTHVYPKKVLHENHSAVEAGGHLTALLGVYRQCMLYTAEADYHILCFGKLKIKKSPPTKKPAALTHDKQKSYILSPDGGYEFLKLLDIMDGNGRVKPSRYDKFRQINKFLELLSADLKTLSPKTAFRVVDFACGKAYLTFSLYYYLKFILNVDVTMTGLDIKEDVIAYCNDTAQRLNFSGLSFQNETISSYKGGADMVVALHACDTATDDCIVKSLDMKARYIFLAPCCQHEFFPQIETKSPALREILRHGVLKERFSALFTDAMRGRLLEAYGYSVGIMEFIDMEHTPKNLMIKAVRTSAPDKREIDALSSLYREMGIEPYIIDRLTDIS